jgi:predicted DNA-binding transcriptional regulator YafY
LEAYCCERNDNRTFRIDRIVEITDVNTGVIYDDGNSFVLAANAAKKIIEQAFGERLNELTVLMSIARADRRVTVEEIKLAYDWFASKASMEVNEAEFARYASTLKPDLSKFTKALIKLKTDTQAYAEIKDLAYKMAKIDGKITPKENEILSLLN